MPRPARARRTARRSSSWAGRFGEVDGPGLAADRIVALHAQVAGVVGVPAKIGAKRGENFVA